MSDSELRSLERYLAANPKDYAAWARYLQTGVRLGRGNSGDRAVVWITGMTPPPRLPGEPYDHENQLAWLDAQERVERLLHQVRNSVGQLSAEALVPLLNRLLSWIYRDPPEVKISTESGIDPIAVVDNTYSICYDERHLHLKEAEIRRRRFRTEFRSIADFTPQYILEAEIHQPGTYSSPPDSDQVTLAVATSFPELARELLLHMEDNSNQEIYNDPREDLGLLEDLNQGFPTVEDMCGLPYRLETMRLILTCIAGIFEGYAILNNVQTMEERDSVITGTIISDELTLLVRSTFTWDLPGRFFSLFQIETPSHRSATKSPSEVVATVWRLWIDHRLRQFFAPS